MITSPTNDASLLRQVPLFSHLSADALQMLCRHVRRRTFRANETLFFTGDPGHTLYVILTGSVKVCRYTPDGVRVVLALLGPGEVLGEMSLLDGGPRSADAVVAEATELLMLDRDGFQTALHENVTMALDLLEVLAGRLRRMNDTRDQGAGLGIPARVARLLLEFAQKYGEDVVGGARRIRRKVTQQEIGEMVGCTRESVNKALSGLKREKAITVDDDGCLILRKIALLERRATGC